MLSVSVVTPPVKGPKQSAGVEQNKIKKTKKKNKTKKKQEQHILVNTLMAEGPPMSGATTPHPKCVADWLGDVGGSFPCLCALL